MAVSVDFPALVEELTGENYLSVTPQPCLLPSPVVSVCKDIVSSYSGDYILFQFDSDEFILLLSNSFERVDGFSYISTSDFAVYDIVVSNNSQTVTKYSSGSLSGTIYGIDSGVDIEQFNGSAVFVYDELQYQPDTYALYYDMVHDKQIMLFNSDNGIIYSSFDGFAKLQDGATYYGYFLCVFAAGAMVFGLIHALFKRLI